MSRYVPHLRLRSGAGSTVVTPTRTQLQRSASARCLRLGLAFVFLYAALFVSGSTRTGGHYVPAFITARLPLRLFLPLFGCCEAALALWLVSGKRSRTAAVLAAALLTAITLPNLAEFHILFRNIAIIAAAVALALLPSSPAADLAQGSPPPAEPTRAGAWVWQPATYQHRRRGERVDAPHRPGELERGHQRFAAEEADRQARGQPEAQ